MSRTRPSAMLTDPNPGIYSPAPDPSSTVFDDVNEIFIYYRLPPFGADDDHHEFDNRMLLVNPPMFLPSSGGRQRIRLVNVDACSSFGAKIDHIPESRPGERTIGIALETNEDGLLTGLDDADGALRFGLANVDLVIKEVEQSTNSRHVLQVKPQLRCGTTEWKAIVQARIFVARSGDKYRMAVAELFKLGTDSEPLKLELDCGIEVVKLELRYIYQTHRVLPTFNEGDLNIHFAHYGIDSPVIHVDKALMALYAPNLAAFVEGLAPNGSCSPPFDVTRDQFTEMLYQIYKAKPLEAANFPELCKAALKLGSKHLQWPLCQQIVNNNELNLVQKVKMAASHGLDDAVRQLCYDAVKSGEWAKLTKDEDLNAREHFGLDIYSRLVVPAIIEATKDKNSTDPELRTFVYEQKHPRPMPNFSSDFEASNPYNVRLLVDGKYFYVNRGVLKINGCLDKLSQSHETTYQFCVSPALKQELERTGSRLKQAVVPLLHLMYGTMESVPPKLIRACLILAHEHGMQNIGKQLEEMLLFEPINSPQDLLNNLLLADKYPLDNLKRRALWHLERPEYHAFGLAMIDLPEYKTLNDRTKMDAEDRLCSGWGIFHKELAKSEPTNKLAFLLKMKPQGAAAELLDNDPELQSNAMMAAADEGKFSEVSEEYAATARQTSCTGI